MNHPVYSVVANDVNNIDAPWVKVTFVTQPHLGEIFFRDGRTLRVKSIRRYSA